MSFIFSSSRELMMIVVGMVLMLMVVVPVTLKLSCVFLLSHILFTCSQNYQQKLHFSTLVDTWVLKLFFVNMQYVRSQQMTDFLIQS